MNERRLNIMKKRINKAKNQYPEKANIPRPKILAILWPFGPRTALATWPPSSCQTGIVFKKVSKAPTHAARNVCARIRVAPCGTCRLFCQLGC